MDTETQKLLEERTALQQRLADIDQYLQLKKKLFGAELRGQASGSAKMTGNLTVRSKRDVILNACDLMLANGIRMTSRELLKGLKNQGIEVGGSDEVLYLSGYLSREKDRYEANRKLGWKLIGSHKRVNPESAPTQSGFLS